MNELLLTSGRFVIARRVTLFLSFLMSGGMLVFPRMPLLFLLVVFGMLAANFRVPIGREMWLLGFILLAVLGVSLLRPGPIHFESLAIRFGNVLGALIILNAYILAPSNSLTHDLYMFFKLMGIQALLTVVLAKVAGFLFIPIAYKDLTYESILLIFTYHTGIDSGGDALVRPDGFFFEPGVFQIYLNLYLYLALFEYRNFRQIILAIAAVLVTKSTTGIIICVTLLGSALVVNLRSITNERKFTLLLVAITVAPILLYVGYDNLTGKISGESKGSSLAREYDFYTGLNIIREYPLMGIGFDPARYLENSYQFGYDDTIFGGENIEERSSSNGLIYMTYSLGVPLAALFLLGFFRQTIFRHKILIGMLLGLSLFGEAIIFTPFIMMIVFSAFTGRSYSILTSPSDHCLASK